MKEETPQEQCDKYLEEVLTKYVKEKHTQDECIGFIDGYKAQEEKIKALEEEIERLNEEVSELEIKLIKSIIG